MSKEYGESFCVAAKTPVVLVDLVLLMLSWNEDNKIVTLKDFNLWVNDCEGDMVMEYHIKVEEIKLKAQMMGR